MDFSVPNPVLEGKPFGYWWDHVHEMLVSHRVTHSQLLRCWEDANPAMTFREGMVPLLQTLHRLSVPVTIVSAGIETIIEEHLRREGVLTDNIRIHANRLTFEGSDKGDKICTGISQRIHSRNKCGTYVRMQEWFDNHSMRLSEDHGNVSAANPHLHRRLLVLGDSVGDARAGANIPAAQQLCVGFYDPNHTWSSRTHFEEAYDVLLPEDGTFHWLCRAFSERGE